MQDLTDALEDVKAKKAEMEAKKDELRAASDAHQKAVEKATELHAAFTESVADLLPSVSRVRSA